VKNDDLPEKPTNITNKLKYKNVAALKHVITVPLNHRSFITVHFDEVTNI
jgi:hypothetical protein